MLQSTGGSISPLSDVVVFDKHFQKKTQSPWLCENLYPVEEKVKECKRMQLQVDSSGLLFFHGWQSTTPFLKSHWKSCYYLIPNSGITPGFTSPVVSEDEGQSSDINHILSLHPSLPPFIFLLCFPWNIQTGVKGTWRLLCSLYGRAGWLVVWQFCEVPQQRYSKTSSTQ